MGAFGGLPRGSCQELSEPCPPGVGDRSGEIRRSVEVEQRGRRDQHALSEMAGGGQVSRERTNAVVERDRFAGSEEIGAAVPGRGEHGCPGRRVTESGAQFPGTEERKVSMNDQPGDAEPCRICRGRIGSGVEPPGIVEHAGTGPARPPGNVVVTGNHDHHRFELQGLGDDPGRHHLRDQGATSRVEVAGKAPFTLAKGLERDGDHRGRHAAIVVRGGDLGCG